MMKFLASNSPAARARRAAIAALLTGASLSTFAAAGPAAAGGENHMVVQGLSVYLGMLPAAVVRGRPEEVMHGAAPSGTSEYHILIAIFDAATGVRIEDAKVTATVSEPGHIGQRSVALDPMSIAGTVTYGNFIELPAGDRFDALFRIGVPGRTAPVSVAFKDQELP